MTTQITPPAVPVIPVIPAPLSAEDYAGYAVTEKKSSAPPSTGFRRRAVGISAAVGGVLVASGFAATVWERAEGKLPYLDSLVVDPMRSQIAAILLFFGYMGIASVLLAFTAMTRSRGRVLGNVALAISWIGTLALPGLLVTDFYDLAIRQELPAETAVRVSDAAQNLPLAVLIGGPTTMLVFAGMVLGAVAAWRAGFFHWSFGLMIVASVAVMTVPLGQQYSAVANIVSGALIGLFMITVGIAALRMTDAQWAGGAR
ncbi:hypothetical protein GCM10009836_27750 [Pseudonocardia ailaonensis]|uniref:DUF4386 family protein n=1 Tax=Pseudonocardia ailaonensis TaxID=367279 RepID=A0ABN2N050_9PSEU